VAFNVALRALSVTAELVSGLRGSRNFSLSPFSIIRGFYLRAFAFSGGRIDR
jgi:hypothetical protein